MPASRFLKIVQETGQNSRAVSTCQFLLPGTTLYRNLRSLCGRTRREVTQSLQPMHAFNNVQRHRGPPERQTARWPHEFVDPPDTCEWVMSHIWMSHVTHENTHIRMGHVTITHQLVVSFIWMRHDIQVSHVQRCCIKRAPFPWTGLKGTTSNPKNTVILESAKQKMKGRKRTQRCRMPLK